MADITITAANVLTVDGKVATGVAGVDITAGQVLYKDTAAANVLKLADADAQLSAVIAGVALHGSLTGQPITYQTSGMITIGGTVVRAEVYHASSSAGGVAPDGEVGSLEYRSILGVGTSTSVITIDINNSGVAVP